MEILIKITCRITIYQRYSEKNLMEEQNITSYISFSPGDIGDFSPKVPAHLDQYPCDISAQERGALSPYNSDEPESP